MQIWILAFQGVVKPRRGGRREPLRVAGHLRKLPGVPCLLIQFIECCPRYGILLPSPGMSLVGCMIGIDEVHRHAALVRGFFLDPLLPVFHRSPDRRANSIPRGTKRGADLGDRGPPWQSARREQIARWICFVHEIASPCSIRIFLLDTSVAGIPPVGKESSSLPTLQA